MVSGAEPAVIVRVLSRGFQLREEKPTLPRVGCFTQLGSVGCDQMLKRDYEGQEPCSVARTLEVVGERWTWLIIRDAFLGLTRFGEFHESLGIARNVLTDRLNRLVDDGVFERVRYSERPPRYEYRLTARGADLFTALNALRQWGDRHLCRSRCASCSGRATGRRWSPPSCPRGHKPSPSTRSSSSPGRLSPLPLLFFPLPRSTRNVRSSPAVVVGESAPAAGVEDKPVRAQVAVGGLAREGAVARAYPHPPADRIGRQDQLLARHGRSRCADRNREAECRLERFDPAAKPGRQDAVDLGQRIVGRRAFVSSPKRRGASRPSTSTTASSSLSIRERKPVARAHVVAAADAALPLDQDAELLERRDVPAKRADVDLEQVRGLLARRDRLRLQGLEEREQPGGGRGHLRSEAHIEGGTRPFSRYVSPHYRDRRFRWRTGHATSTSGWAAGTCATYLRERLRGSDDWIEFDAKVVARPLLDGLGNEDEFRTDHEGGFIGMSFASSTQRRRSGRSTGRTPAARGFSTRR